MPEPYQLFEGEFAAWAKAPNVVGCASGTAALHLALEALQLPPGSEVITGDYNMIAVPRAIVLAGHSPVFVDCGDNLLLRPELLAKALSHETRAILVTHIYGRRADMEAVAELAQTAGVPVIEDMAELHGVKPHKGSAAACWSFYRNKVIRGEEGGAVVFPDATHAALARQLRTLGFTDAHDYNHLPRGHNYRLSNAHARLIRDSLAVADANIFLRRQIEALYEAHCPSEWRMPRRDSVWVYDLRIPGMTTEGQRDVVEALQDHAIAARHGFKPMSSQAEFRGCRTVGGNAAARAASEVIYLPVEPGRTTERDARMAFDVIRRAL